jgi:lipopolysaccharide transport system permease protein
LATEGHTYSNNSENQRRERLKKDHLTSMNKLPDNTAIEQWDTVITPKKSLFELNLKEVWQYRDLLFLFVRRDFVAMYKQTILGPLWYFIQPILTTMMFTVVFGRIAKIPTDGIPPMLFYLAGITNWNYFSSCLSNVSNLLETTKVYLAKYISPD